MIDLSLHRKILLGILKDIYQDRTLAPLLGFKGGTCLYFFHELPRFSTDLDFNLLQNSESFESQTFQKILQKNISIKDFHEKKNTWFWLGSYTDSNRTVKIEISKRQFPDKYEIKDFYGIAVQCLEKSCLFAHKLCAVQDRKMLAMRDLFDVHFMFTKNFPIAHNIIELRTGLKTPEYFQKLGDYIPKHITKRGVLDGLGDVLNPEQKKWAQDHLLKELLFYLKSYVS